MTFFVRLWEAGWIYRANRIVNWCPHHQTAISDLEVEHVEMDDTLFHARYPFADGDGWRSRSRRCARRRSSPTSPSRCIPTTRATATRSAREVDRPGRRAARARDRRRARRARVRHGRAQDHPGPRPDRLRDRARPRARDAHRDRARRPDHRRGLRGPRRRQEADEQIVAWLEEHGPAREARALPPLGRHVRALPLADRAARLAAVVVPDGRARAPGDRGAARAARPLPPGEPAPVRDRVARERARLVRLAAALVGPPDPDLDVPRRSPDVRVAAAGGVRRVRRRPRSSATPTCSTRGSRSALWPFATLGWPERTAGARAVLPGRRQRRPRARSSASGRTG